MRLFCLLFVCSSYLVLLFGCCLILLHAFDNLFGFCLFICVGFVWSANVVGYGAYCLFFELVVMADLRFVVCWLGCW